MNWYIAKLVFQIKGEGMQRHQFDEHLRLVEAENFEDAFFIARMLGISFEETVINKEHGLVQWEFVNVAELRPLNIRSGVELHTQVREIDEGNHYVNFIHNQAACMQLDARPQF
ncbi:MAG: DUF4288 domain-containing protein [Bacteroidetes bacterium]|nr:DUF4288 domain-containing protein [Bacteroidota bacterium]